MNLVKLAARFLKGALTASALLLAGQAAQAQQVVNLGVFPASTQLPDGNVVPMWTYSCGPAATGSTASCAATNPAVQAKNAAAITAGTALPGLWSPVVITVPAGQDLQINLQNNLSFTPTGATTANNIPTSLTIVGQLGGGLGSNPTYVASPTHPQQGQTWYVANGNGASFLPSQGTVFTPPTQPNRVQSFATEVAAGTTTSLCWGVCGKGLPALKPGTYLIESGTHPSIQVPMGLYGVLVVTSAPTAASGAETAPGVAYPVSALASSTAPFYPSGVSYDAELALVMGEIDPVQNAAVNTAVTTAGFNENASMVLGNAVTSVTLSSGGSGYTIPGPNNTTLTDGTLPITFSPSSACKLLPQGTATIAGGVVTSISVTSYNASTVSGTAYGSGCVLNVTASVPGGVTPAQISVGMSSTNLGVQCNVPAGGTTQAAACYPPAVNYTPTYYLINGQAFDKTNATNSLYPVGPGYPTGSNVLVRLVNAGLRTHVPSIVGATTTSSYSAAGKLATPASIPGLTLVAEDGNPLPGVPRVQSEVYMPAGKTYDILINPAATSAALPIYDRQLSLSGGTIDRDAGMVAYIGTSSSAAIAAASSTTGNGTQLGKAVANADTYNVLLGQAGQVITISDISKGVIANDINVFGVTLLAAPNNGTVTLNRDGTFTYTASGTAKTDSFTYCANGSVTGTTCSSGIVATVNIGPNGTTSAGVTCGAFSVTATTSSYYTINPPGVLSACKDGANLTMQVANPTTLKPVGAQAPLVINLTAATGTTGTGTVTVDANGGFQASVSAPGTYTFPFSAVNSLGLGTPTAGTATITFQTPSNLNVTVLDGADKKTVITDYRWIIEEDQTFYVDPACTKNPVPAGCPQINQNNGTNSSTQFNFGTSFHTSAMPVIAAGCTGPLSCESGQSVQGVPAVCDVGNGVCRTSAAQRATSLPSQVHLDPSKRYYISIFPGDAANPFASGYASTAQCASALVGSTQTSVPSGTCGHGMGGAPINKNQTSVLVLTQPSPYPTAHVTAFVYQDDYPLNGEHDAGGGVDVLAAQEPGLGGFQVLLQDVAGATGGMTGTPTYDMFNQPLSNAMAGTIDPVTLLDACPISAQATNSALTGVSIGSVAFSKGSNAFTIASIPTGLTVGVTLADTTNGVVLPVGTTVTGIQNNGTSYTVTMSAAALSSTPAAGEQVTALGAQAGITGMVVTCPKYESDGKTLSPIAGMAMINNLYPGRYSVQVIPGADRIARGEEWLQTNTLDGQKAHDAFLRIGEPAYFQEYGPSGFHVNIGYANPKIINERRHNANNTGWCDSGTLNSLTNGNGALVGALDCSNTVTGFDTLARMSRTPDERLYSSGSRTALSFTQCYAALSDPDGATFAFTKCDPVTGQFTFGPSASGANDGVPAGNWMLTIFDQWNDQIIDGISTPVSVNCSASQGGGLCNATVTSATATVTAASANITITSSPLPVFSAGTAITDSLNLFPAGTTVVSQSGNVITLSANATKAGAADLISFPSGAAINVATAKNQVINLGEVATHQWQSNIYTKTFLDTNGTGLWKDSSSSAPKPGVALVPTNIRFRDGSISNFGGTDLNGIAPFNEIFPLFNWYVVETDDARFKNTGVHVVYDAGGPVDNSSPGGTPCYGASSSSTSAGPRPCGNSDIGTGLANTWDTVPLPKDLWIPGAVYCNNADCYGKTIAAGSAGSDAAPTFTDDPINGGVIASNGFSTGRIDPPFWFGSYGWQGYSGQANFIEWGKKPFVPGETGGIRGHVVYASTRPYDNPTLLLQNLWEPLVPHVQINLYQQTFAADGVTPVLTLIDHTTTTSWDDWAQGYRTDASGNLVKSSDAEGGAIPNISCSGQSSSDLFFYGIKNQPQWLDFYNNQLHGTGTAQQMAYNAQFKCFDGMHPWNQLQPAPYDGMYTFPSVTGFDPKTGKPLGTNCTACVTNVDAADPYRYGGSTTPAPYKSGSSTGTPVLPAGNYVVEVVVPPGFEIVKEEDKNILIGDNFIAPATQEIPGLGTNLFILPDQAVIGNAYNAQNSTQSLGRNNLPNSEADTGMQEQYWPCVGAARQVPDFISLFPQSQEVAPFAGATRNLCDRKLVTLNDQSSAQTKFFIWTPTHIAGHFTGIILDDFTSEFDPYSPGFGEKFAPSYLPVSVKDWAGNEVNRMYSDQFGLYNGLSYSTWEVNPPNPTGYAPTMMVMCMNDAGYGTINPWWDTTASGFLQTSSKRDPFFEYGYSQFCYELPFMPGRTGYFDTPVTPDAAFTDGYNHPDCSYPNLTPAIASVTGDVAGPWVAAPGSTLTINALGDQQVENYGYSGPSITTAPWNAQQITRHYGFGGTAGTVAIVGSDGVAHALTGVKWTDGQITGVVPSGIPACAVQQQAQFGQPATTTTSTGNGTVRVAKFAKGATTVTVSGTLPTTLAANDPISGTGIATGTTVSSISGTTITLSKATSAATTGTETLNYTYTTTTVTPAVTACGQLQITTATGQTSVDTVTVTVGGKTPTVMAAGSTIQSYIDAASPGDMIIVPPGVYNEMLVMWKPVRLQGVGAASSIVDATAIPAGKLLNPWRQKIDCLFGLSTQGRPRTANDMSCASGLQFTKNLAATGYVPTAVDAKIDDVPFAQILVDRLPFEAILGWDAGLNGNLAEQSIEPSLMGAMEGAAITVLGKGVRFVDGSTNPTPLIAAYGGSPGDIATTVGAAYPDNTVLLNANDCQANTTQKVTISTANIALNYSFGAAVGGSDTTNRYPGNYYCNPSSIDGLGIRDASQGGGGIYVHAYAHNLQIANNRVYGNLGTLSGGITIGQGEHPDVNLGGTASVITAPPSCELTNQNITNAPMPFCFDTHVSVHNNAVYENVSLGDELFSSTPAGAGGISVNTGADYYQISSNWICGNLSSGDGGGLSHIGYIKNGLISHNSILFNKSANPSISTNGAGLLVMGAPDVDPTCGANNDQDCVALPTTVTPSDGSGPGTVVDANLILGNSADAGSGGGMRLQNINGNDLVNWPNATVAKANGYNGTYTNFWNSVSVTNNIIVNNVAGWDGGGISLQDALYVNLVNNTVAHNDSTATAGPLFGSLFAPLSSAPTSAVGCYASMGSTTSTNVASCPQVAGIVSVPNSLLLRANTVQANGSNSTTALTCPAAYGGANCWLYSSPLIFNDLVWQNRSFVVTTQGLGTGNGNQQQVVTLMNADASFPAPNKASNPTTIVSQGTTGACPASGSAYWDLGVRGDQGPTSTQGLQLFPHYSGLGIVGTLYANANNLGGDAGFNPAFEGVYCNGGRTPPEAGGQGWFVPPGTNETNGACGGPGCANQNSTNPMYFSLVATATTDEGNNWINMRWGPLSLTVPSNDSAASNTTAPVYLGNYAIGSTSGALGKAVASFDGVAAPTHDFFNNPRPGRGSAWDIGAVEFQNTSPAVLSVTPTSLNFGTTVLQGTTSAAQTLTLTNNGGVAATGITVAVTAPFSRPAGTAGGTCGATLNGGASCTINVVFTPTSTTAATGTATITASVPVTGSPVALSGTGAPLTPAALVSTNSVSFGSWHTGSASNPVTLTVTNVGNVALTGGTFTFGATAPFTHVGGTCGTTLAVGASCTYTVRYTAPATAGTSTVNLTIAYGSTGGAATVTNSPVSLTGTAVATAATFAAAGPTPNPSLAKGVLTGSFTVTLTNTSTTTSGAVTADAVTGSGINLTGTWAFTKGADTCTGANLAPGGACTLVVNVTRLGGAGVHNAGVSFTDSAGTTTASVPVTLN